VAERKIDAIVKTMATQGLFEPPYAPFRLNLAGGLTSLIDSMGVMCGRFNLITDAGALVDFFELGQGMELQPRYNIAPSRDVAIVREVIIR